jgi:hypothetical protein
MEKIEAKMMSCKIYKLMNLKTANFKFPLPLERGWGEVIQTK